ncbi:MAG: OmpA family protein [Nitrospirota bacterium]|nr:OmpA family protein [Nitrospirota bacterium]
MRGVAGVTLILGLCLVGASGCAENDPYRNTKLGTGIGAVSGAGLGAIFDSKNRGRGAAIGATVGALAGAGAGYYMDQQQRDIERDLEQELQSKAIELRRLEDNTLQLNLRSEASFDVNSAQIKPGFGDSLIKIASILGKYDRTVIHILGHTDNTGSDAYNQQLSERRANTVASYLGQHRISQERLRAEGFGEHHPRATNATEIGRRNNRRVELYLKPIVEGREAWAYATPI